MTYQYVRGVVAAALAWCSLSVVGTSKTPHIQVLLRDPAPRVDVLVDGKPFTSYVYLHSLPGPILDPVRAPDGTVVTHDASNAAATPVGEAPQPLGLWFRHADVNGVDFSGTGRPDGRRGPGIVHRRVIEATSGDERGQLGVEAAWIGPDQTPMLVESTWFVFGAGQTTRRIDRITRLTATDGTVRLRHTPNGQVGIRLAPAFLNDRGIISAAGPRLGRASLPATRSRWVAVAAVAGSRPITVALLDHPENPGFPAAWRLDAAGSLETVPVVDVTIDSNRSVTFRHCLIVISGPPDTAIVEREYQAFVSRR